MINRHYSKKYFEYQKNVGQLGAILNKFKFAQFVSKNDVVIDFGCGGGYLLKNLNVKSRLGVEVNPEAVKQARQNKIKIYSKSESIENNIADVIISNNALEHVDEPLLELKILRKKLKKNGKLVLVVPHERISEWGLTNIDQHLYTWSPMNLGNLITRAGFKVDKIDYIKYKWPPIYYQEIHQLLGKTFFDLFCYIYGHLNTKSIQLRVVARNK